MEGLCYAAVPGSQSLPLCFTQGTDHVPWLHSLCQLCVLYPCCVLSARAAEMLCRCCLNPFSPSECWWRRARTLGAGQGGRQVAWEVLSPSPSVKLWLPPKLCSTVCLHWAREERGNFLIGFTSAAAQGPAQLKFGCKVTRRLQLLKQNYLCYYLSPNSLLCTTSVGLKNTQLSAAQMVPLAPSCLWLLWELQAHPRQGSKLRPNLLLCQESPWRPRDPAVISSGGAKQKFREIPRRSGKCGCGCAKPRSPAARSRRGFSRGLLEPKCTNVSQ